MKIFFFDIKNEGHHWFYNTTLMINIKKATNKQVFYITKNINENQQNFLKENEINVVILKNGNNFSNKIYMHFVNFKDYIISKRIAANENADTFVNLYFDQYLPQYLFSSKKLKIVNILHWFPNNSYKIKIIKKLKQTSENYFLVHTDDIKKRIENINSKISVNYINYPVKTLDILNYNKKEAIASLDLPLEIDKKFTLLYFGGTRHDKGLDILLESLKLVSCEVNLLIVGKEELFTKSYILKESESIKSNVSIFTKLEFVPEEDIQKYFYISDIIVMPYRKYFNGESGVLTDAIQAGKPVIVPNIIHFPSILNSYKNGSVFNAEDPKELANAIESTLSNYEDYLRNAGIASNHFAKTRNTDKFAEKFIEFFEI